MPDKIGRFQLYSDTSKYATGSALYQIQNGKNKLIPYASKRLHMPDKIGRFQLYSDTSKYATGCALYQIQNGKPKLIPYASKRLPEAAGNYSITELEMCGLAINIMSFAHLLRKVDFDAVVDHLAITQIMKSKVEPATNRIKRLLEVLSAYSFNLYYIKGKDMILSDFLSRENISDGDSNEIIPILFNMRMVLQR